MTVKAVDLFCGAGGLTHGLLNAGIEVVAGYDIAESCRFAYEHNNKAQFINQSVPDLAAADIHPHLADADYTLLAGCAPCQPFSTYARTTKSKLSGIDERRDLLSSFARLVSEVKPDFVTMENVPGLMEQSVFKSFIKLLKNHGYFIDYRVIYCPDYGMAQTRKRLVLVASSLGKISLIPPTHSPAEYRSVADAIKKLPPIAAGETHPDDPLHRASTLSPLNMRRIRASVQGGSWWDWPEELRAACHIKESGKTFPGVYGRMSWEKPSPTITTQCNGFGNGRFGHPEQDRAISLREAALLQSFPLNYQFSAPDNIQPISALAKMIGNAVPVRLGEIVGKTILSHIESLSLLRSA